MQDPNENQSQPAEDVAADAAAKPKRTRRPKAAEAATESPAVAVSTAESSESSAPAVKRAPRRRKVDVAEASADVPAVADAAAPQPANAAVEVKPKRAPRKKAVATESDVPALVQPVVEQSQEQVREPAGDGFLQLAPVAEAEGASSTPSQELDGEASGRGEGDAGRRGERGGRHRRDRDRDRGPRAPRPERLAGEGGADGEAAVEGESDQAPSRRAAMAAEQAKEVFAEVLAGHFDDASQEESAEAEQSAEATKRVLRPEPDAPKLQKVLAQSGVGSRRDIEQMIEDGAITVNGEVAHIGQRVSYGDQVKISGKPIKIRIAPQPARILAYHKPVGEVVTHDDPQGRPTVFRRLPRLMHGKWMSVGRLDLNTEGLLLFTTSGELANQLMHPRFGVEREYAVRVLGTLDEAARARLLEGVNIEGQVASFKSIENGGGEGVNHWYRVVITEGRNREVRKLFDSVGLAVSRLIRVRYGSIVLPLGLKRGVWVELGESDVRAVKSMVGLDRQDGGNRGGRHGKQQGQQGQGGPKGGKQQGQRYPQQGPQGQNQNRPPRGGQGEQRMQQAAPRSAAPDYDDDIDHIGHIPNPLEQTFDKRFVKGSKRISQGFGRPDHDHQARQDAAAKKGGPRQPDPLQTSVGYIGADAYFNKAGGRSGRGGGGGGGRGRR